MQAEAVTDVVRSALGDVVDAEAYAAYLLSVLESDASMSALRPLLESVLDSAESVNEVGGQLLLAFQAGKMGTSATAFDDDLDDYAPAPSEAILPRDTGTSTAPRDGAGTSGRLGVKSRGGGGSKQKKRGAAMGAAESALQAELLAGFSTAPSLGQSSKAPQGGGAAPVCRYFAAGNCMLRDCAFSHDLASTPCRYWLTPEGCTRPDCTFWHPQLSSDLFGGPVPGAELAGGALRAPAPAEGPPGSGGVEAASSSATSASFDSLEAFDGAGDDKLGLWLLSWLQEHPDADSGAANGDDEAHSEQPRVELDTADPTLFPALPQGPEKSPSTFAAPLLSPTGKLRSSGGSTSASLSDAESLAALLSSKVCFSAPARGSSSSDFSFSKAPAAAAAAARASFGPHERIARGITEALEWVDTGEAVSALYRDMRAEAEVIAKSRNLAFHRATQAFLAGHKAEAARMARHGRELQAQMQRAHAAAAGAIFAARNSSRGGTVAPPATAALTGAGQPLPPPTRVTLPQGGGSVDVCVFDLHGLHPSEAADAAKDVIASMRPPLTWAAFLTGTRHHSRRLGKGGTSLQEAVLEVLSLERGVEAYTPAAKGRSVTALGGVVVARVSK